MARTLTHAPNTSAGVNWGPSGGSSMCIPRSEDPHWCQQKLSYIFTVKTCFNSLNIKVSNATVTGARTSFSHGTDLSRAVSARGMAATTDSFHLNDLRKFKDLCLLILREKLLKNNHVV